MTRFLFGSRGRHASRRAPTEPLRPPPEYPADDTTKSDDQLFQAVIEVTKDGGVATEEERGGVFYGVTRPGSDGSFDFEQRHYMQPCRCHVIDNLIVQWCPAHAAYYRRVLTPEQFLIGADLARHWKGVETK